MHVRSDFEMERRGVDICSPNLASRVAPTRLMTGRDVYVYNHCPLISVTLAKHISRLFLCCRR